MEEFDPTRCVTCGISQDEQRLTKCVVCHKPFCDECAARYSGRRFCTKSCGQFFFHDDESDIDRGGGGDSDS